MRKTLAIIAITGTAFFLLGWLTAGVWTDFNASTPGPQTESKAEPKQEMVWVLVAKKDVQKNRPLRGKPEDYFIAKEFPATAAPKDALREDDLPKMEWHALNRGLRAGHFVTMEDLTPARI